MESSSNDQSSFWQFSDQLRLQTSSLANLSLGGGDSIWNDAFLSSKRNEERRNLDFFQNQNQNQVQNQTQKQNGLLNSNNSSFGWKGGIGMKSSFNTNNNSNGYFNKEVGKSVMGGFRKNYNSNDDFSGKGSPGAAKKKNGNNNNNNNSDKNNNSNDKISVDKRFKTLPASEALPRNEAVGGYIFVCNNDTMPENLRRELFGLPPRYRDSVRAITPGLPLFLYNYSTHQLHGLFQAASFGGSNIDPTAWEDKKCPGESRFPAQVRAKTKKVCEPLEEDAFRPILHHYDGPKFRLELSVPEALALLDKFEEINA